MGGRGFLSLWLILVLNGGIVGQVYAALPTHPLSSPNEELDSQEFHDFIEEAKRRCSQPLEGEPYVLGNHFSWNMTLENIKKTSQEIYASGLRMRGRVFYDSQKNGFFVPIDYTGKSFARVPEEFLYSVSQHINEALKREYVHEVIFPDMGHSHFFIPQDYYDQVVTPLLGQRKQAEAYEMILRSPGLKILYHTAEQLKMRDEEGELLPDRLLQWRFFTRNLVGYNLGQRRLELHKNLVNPANTSTIEEPSFRYYGGGVYLNASSQGCFNFKQDGEKKFFDMSHLGLPYEGGGTF